MTCSKNIVKVHSEYHNESTQLKGSITLTRPEVFQELGNIYKVARRAFVMNYIFNNLPDMQIFARIRKSNL